MTRPNAPTVGDRVTAETEQGKRVRIEITRVEAAGPNGWEVWGYRLGTVQRRRAQTMYPRRYFIVDGAA